MARDADALLIRKWAASSALVQTPEDAGLTRATGLPAEYGTNTFLALEVFNQLWRELTAAAVEVAQHGILPWHASQDYAHDPVSLVIGSDRNLYRSVQASGPSSTAQDPTTDTGGTYWVRFALDVENSSTTERGIIRTATNAETVAGTATSPAVTPAGLAAAIAAATPPAGDGEHYVTAAGSTTFSWPWSADTARVVAVGGGGGGGGALSSSGLGPATDGTAGADTTVTVNSTTVRGDGGSAGVRGFGVAITGPDRRAVGNGGNGGRASTSETSTRNGNAGGAGAATAMEISGLSLNDSFAITVGAGGTAGSSHANADTDASAGGAGFALIVPVYG